MNPTVQQATNGTPHWQDVWRRYRANLPRHCMGISRHLQASLMHALNRQHRQLRLNYEPYISLVGSEGARLTDLAEWLSISKQACNQTVNQLQRAGYLLRAPDPGDGRAKQVLLTQRGRELVAQGSRLAAKVEQEYAGLIGQQAFSELVEHLSELHDGLGLPGRRPALHRPSSVSGLLPRVTGHMLLRLMELTRSRGHPGLKMSFAQVLTLIGPGGGRIQQMARIQEVSKQAISAVASELERQTYIRREPDPAGHRQVLLKLTGRGQQLLADSVGSIEELESELELVIGAAALRGFKLHTRQLYGALRLEEEVFGGAAAAPADGPDVQHLAQRLQRQLGRAGAVQLARLLLDQRTGEPMAAVPVD